MSLRLCPSLPISLVSIQQGEQGDHFYVAKKGAFNTMVASAPLALDTLTRHQ